MSRLAQHQRNMARRQTQGKHRHLAIKTYVVKNVGTRKTLTVNAATRLVALDQALALGLAKSLDKLVVVA